MPIKKYSVIKELNRTEAVARLAAVADSAIKNADFRNKAKFAAKLGPELAKAGLDLSNAEIAFVAGWLEANKDAVAAPDSDGVLVDRIKVAVGSLLGNTGANATG